MRSPSPGPDPVRDGTASRAPGGAGVRTPITTRLPRPILRLVWALHLGIARVSGGRLGTRRPGATGVGTLFLLTTGRRSGITRRVGLFYLRTGDRLVVVASNAGSEQEPAWLRNLRAAPEAEVELSGGERRRVVAREATPEERDQLWPELVRRYPAYATYAERIRRSIPVVLLESP